MFLETVACNSVYVMKSPTLPQVTQAHKECLQVSPQYVSSIGFHQRQILAVAASFALAAP